MDAHEFDNSKDKPVTLPVKGVIKGRAEALQLMPVGSKLRKLRTARQARPIGPNTTLVFEMELLSIGYTAAYKPLKRRKERPPPKRMPTQP